MWLLKRVFLNGQGLRLRPLYGLDVIKASDKNNMEAADLWPSIKSKYDQ